MGAGGVGDRPPDLEVRVHLRPPSQGSGDPHPARQGHGERALRPRAGFRAHRDGSASSRSPVTARTSLIGSNTYASRTSPRWLRLNRSMSDSEPAAPPEAGETAPEAASELSGADSASVRGTRDARASSSTGGPGGEYPVEAIPEPVPRMTLHHRVQRRDHGPVAFQGRLGRSVIHRPRESSDLAGAPRRQPVLPRQDPHCLPPRGRRYSFRFSRSLIAAFSSARSLYSRFSFAFSASRKLTDRRHGEAGLAQRAEWIGAKGPGRSTSPRRRRPRDSSGPVTAPVTGPAECSFVSPSADYGSVGDWLT